MRFTVLGEKDMQDCRTSTRQADDHERGLHLTRGRRRDARAPVHEPQPVAQQGDDLVPSDHPAEFGEPGLPVERAEQSVKPLRPAGLTEIREISRLGCGREKK